MQHCPICNQNFGDDVTTCKFDGNALVELASTGDPLVGTILNGRYRILKRLATVACPMFILRSKSA